MFLSRKLSGSSCRQRQPPAAASVATLGGGLPASEASTGSSTGEKDWLPCEAEAGEGKWGNKIWKIYRETSVTLPKITAGMLRFHLSDGIYRPHSPAKAEEERVRGLTSWTGSSCTWHTQTQLVNPANCQRDGLQKCNPGHFPENMPANPIFIL